MELAIDVTFEPNDAMYATMLAASQPVVLDSQPPSAPPSQMPFALAPTIAAHPTNTAPPERRTVWWPIVLMGFFVGTCATIAFLKSPLAEHPKVAPHVQTVMAYTPSF